VCGHINSTSILCIYLSFFLSFFEARAFVGCLFVCFKEKQIKQTSFLKKICFVDRFFPSAPPQVLGGFFFPETLERNVVGVCVLGIDLFL